MSTFIIGDLHGYHEKYIHLLREKGLVMVSLFGWEEVITSG
jgi:hypothetical protein|tara:strand:+ start:906 stop:1028 length:123 start_codon:yes stop_codon:yes gene_type:complete